MTGSTASPASTISTAGRGRTRFRRCGTGRGQLRQPRRGGHGHAQRPARRRRRGRARRWPPRCRGHLRRQRRRHANGSSGANTITGQERHDRGGKGTTGSRRAGRHAIDAKTVRSTPSTAGQAATSPTPIARTSSGTAASRQCERCPRPRPRAALRTCGPRAQGPPSPCSSCMTSIRRLRTSTCAAAAVAARLAHAVPPVRRGRATDAGLQGRQAEAGRNDRDHAHVDRRARQVRHSGRSQDPRLQAACVAPGTTVPLKCP